MNQASLALGFATIDRPQVVQRLVRSAREHLGAIPIYVADQSIDVDIMRPFYRAHDVRLIEMPHDIGVTASRNQLAREIAEEFFALCDDDFVMSATTRFDDALAVMRSRPEIGVLGGRLYDFDGIEETVRHWEMYLQYDPRNRALLSMPIDALAPQAREVAGVRYFLCDAVLNFAVMRRSMFETGVSWDERFKSNGEHEDFFLNLKVNTSWRVAYLPTMHAYHHHPEEFKQYRERLRHRNHGWRLLLEKWGVDQHFEHGLGVRSIDDVDTQADMETTRARFYVNPDISVRRDQSPPGTLLVDLDGNITSLAALDATGEAVLAPQERRERLLFNRDTGALLLAAAEAPPSAAAPAREIQLWRRYGLGATDSMRVVDEVDGDFYFRYDAALRRASDLILWCWRKDGRCNQGRRMLAATLRWTCDHGVSLVWRSNRVLLDCSEATYWRPLHVELPIVPSGVNWLRFDILTDAQVHPLPIATGFLFATTLRDDKAKRQRLAPAMALTRLARDGATPGAPGMTVDELGRRGASRPLEFESLPHMPALRAITPRSREGLEALYFANWSSLGTPLLAAKLPPPEIFGQALLAAPGAGLGARVYGFGRQAGLVALRSAWRAA